MSGRVSQKLLDRTVRANMQRLQMGGKGWPSTCPKCRFERVERAIDPKHIERALEISKENHKLSVYG